METFLTRNQEEKDALLSYLIARGYSIHSIDRRDLGWAILADPPGAQAAVAQ